MSLVCAGWNLQLKTLNSLDGHFCLMQLLKDISCSCCAMGTRENGIFVPRVFCGGDLLCADRLCGLEKIFGLLNSFRRGSKSLNP